MNFYKVIESRCLWKSANLNDLEDIGSLHKGDIVIILNKGDKKSTTKVLTRLGVGFFDYGYIELIV